MDPTPAAGLGAFLGRSREVKTLMGLTGRNTWVLGTVVVTAIASNPTAPLDAFREGVVVACGIAWAALHVAAYVLGIVWPDQFHYGAEHRLKVKQMEMGDSLSARRRVVAEKQEKP